MRFEKLAWWSFLAMLLMGGAGWEQSVAGDAPDSKTTFQASDSGTDVPPPRP